MTNNFNQQGPFWDFVHGINNNNNNNGAGVDHQANAANSFPFSFFGPPPPPGQPGSHPPPPPMGFGGPFGPGGFGHGHFGHRSFGGPGCRGRRGRRHGRGEGSREHTPSHDHEGSSDSEHGEGNPREGSPHGDDHTGPQTGPHAHGHRGGRHRHHGRRGNFGGPRGGFPMSGAGGLDLSALLESLSAHPWAQAFQRYAEQAAAQGQRSAETLVPEPDQNSFVPPIDIFITPSAYILHVALPGAKKEDVGVNWDAEQGVLNLAGVVYRQGDEEFLKRLSQSERKVGVFERTVQLPPGNQEREEVDGDAITAKLEDGVLTVTVPKLEKDWTEVKRVDIE